jgi:hypothetical protein
MITELIKDFNSEDRLQIVHLLASSFPMEYLAGVAHFNFFIDQCPDKRYIIVRNEEKVIVGIYCLLHRKLYYDGVTLNLIGLSYGAILPAYRNFSVSEKLKKRLFEYLKDKSDVSLAFARKKLDNYWYPYGFLGFTNFGNISIEMKDVVSPSSSIQVSVLEKDDLRYAKLMFEETYVREQNLIYRSNASWAYILKKISTNRQEVYAIKTSEGVFVGYFFRKNNTVEEICIDNQFMGQITRLLCKIIQEENPGATEINFQIGIAHSFAKYIKNTYHHSIQTRFAWKGGHIIRVSNIQEFFSKISSSIEKKLNLAKVGTFFIEYAGISFLYNGYKLKIEIANIDGCNVNIQRLFWQKLIFGVQDASDYLTNSSEREKILPFLKIMFPVRNPQIPLMDQF